MNEAKVDYSLFMFGRLSSTRTEKVRTVRGRFLPVVGAVAATTLALGCLLGQGGALASSPSTADRDGPVAQAAPRADPLSAAEARRRVDRMGGSGSAGLAPATEAAAARVAQADQNGDIRFSVPGGTFQGQLSVSLGTSIPGAVVRYTTNGKKPTDSSTPYRGPLALTATTQVRAQAFQGTRTVGAPGSSVYVARSVDARHDLPLVVLDAYGGGKPTRQYEDVAAMVIPARNGQTSLSSFPAVATRAAFHVRGQSSATFEKTPYRLEFRDNDNKDADYPVLGMPADADWALRGPFPDKTLLRDAFAYGLGREMGLRTPRFAFVEVYLNLDESPLDGEDYQGVYLLVETIENTPDRLGLQRMETTDVTEPAVTGGYVLQFDVLAADPPILACKPASPQDQCWNYLEVLEPKDLQPKQETWLTDYVQKFHNSLRSENPSDPRTGYPAYIDVDSFVNRIIHNELARETDAYIRSTHFFKDRGGKLVAGPLWDYDLGYAAFTGFGGIGAPPLQGWQFEPVWGLPSAGDWFLRLMQDPTFQAKTAARWEQLRGGVLSDVQLMARVEALSTHLTAAAERNFRKWPNLDVATVGGFGTQTTQTWEEQVQIMRTFLVQRSAWLDGSGWRPTVR
ncbi:MAG: hypothetical protein QG608_2234 [Actinomycetota bacterium]|nr:hypothetical protein [Actinomycetota bacterium]